METEHETEIAINAGKNDGNTKEDNDPGTQQVAAATKNQAVKNKSKKKYLFILAVAVLIIAAFIFADPNRMSFKQKHKVDELKAQLSETITEDYLPGTYVSEDGKVFAISVSDDSVFDINFTLAKMFRGNTSTLGRAVLPDVQWTTDAVEVNAADQTISLLYLDSPVTYKYELDKNRIILTDYQQEEATFIKISDEYNAQISTTPELMTIDDILGVYTGNYMLSVKQHDDDTVDVCLYDYNFDRVLGLAEQVPYEEFVGGNYVFLRGDGIYNTYYIKISGRDTFSGEGRLVSMDRRETDKNLSSEINEYKSQHPEVDYNYSSFKDITVMEPEEEDGNKFSFDLGWYKTYYTFRGDVVVTESKYVYKSKTVRMEIKEIDDDTLQVLRMGEPYCTFKKFDYKVENEGRISYMCDNGEKISVYYPASDPNSRDEAPIRITVESPDTGYIDDNSNSNVTRFEYISPNEEEHWSVYNNSFRKTNGNGRFKVGAGESSIGFEWIGDRGENNGGIGSYSWSFDIEPTVGPNGELIYKREADILGENWITITYYPDDPHIVVDTDEELIKGEYWLED